MPCFKESFQILTLLLRPGCILDDQALSVSRTGRVPPQSLLRPFMDSLEDPVVEVKVVNALLHLTPCILD